MEGEMIARRFFKTVVATLIATGGLISEASADVNNYQFKLVNQAVKIGAGVVITVRLVNKSTGSPVPDAVIAASRLDMTPDGMPTMTTRLESIPGAEPGTYQFKADIRMAGRWQLSLGVRVPGERAIVERKLIIKADK